MTLDEAGDPLLRHALDELVQPGLLIGYRSIAPRDANALLPAESASIVSPVLDVRRASGAARIVARGLLARLGHGGVAIPKASSGAPVWPAGVTGSLAHDRQIAVAAVALTKNFAAIGIDVEPAEPLPPEMLELVTTPRERNGVSDDPMLGRLLFAAKEAVYKAAYPCDGVFLEFHDIEIDLVALTATTNSGRIVALRYSLTPRIVVLAFASA